MTKEKGIRYFPLALFTSVMGVAGLALALGLIEDIFNLSNIYSQATSLLATVMFIINFAILLYRIIYFTEDVKTDFGHPVRMNFFGAISISLLLLGALYYDFNNGLSFITWLLGALFQFILTLVILSRLIWHHEFKLPQFNPTWFIPIVGNIIVPIAGVYHTEAWLNWMFFSIGVLFSIIYFTIFMNRIFFQATPPKPLLPTFFILIAPPGIGFVSYVKMVGEVDVFAYILFGIAFYLGLLLVFQLKRFIASPFFISWWAYLFPSAAVTNATIILQQYTGSGLLKYIYGLQIVGLLVLTLYLFGKTMQLLIEGKLCVKEG